MTTLQNGPRSFDLVLGNQTQPAATDAVLGGKLGRIAKAKYLLTVPKHFEYVYGQLEEWGLTPNEVDFPKDQLESLGRSKKLAEIKGDLVLVSEDRNEDLESVTRWYNYHSFRLREFCYDLDVSYILFLKGNTIWSSSYGFDDGWFGSPEESIYEYLRSLEDKHLDFSFINDQQGDTDGDTSLDDLFNF